MTPINRRGATFSHRRNLCTFSAAYEQLGDLDHALPDFDYVVKAQPGKSESYHDRGLVYFKMGNREKARDDFNKALQLAGDQAMRDDVEQHLKQLSAE